MDTTDSPERLDLVTRGGLHLVADRWVGGDRGTVLFLHGGGQTRHSWKKAGIRIAEAGFTAVTLDLRGHGDSDWSPDGDYHMPAVAQDVVDVVDVLGGPVSIVGASFGGLTGIFAADQLGDRATALVLVDIVPRLEPAGADRIVSFMASAPDGFATLDEAAEAIAAYLPHRKRRGPSEGLRKNLRQRDNGRWYWHWDPAFLTRRPSVDDHRVDELERTAAQLTLPLLVLRGVLSDVVGREGIEAFQRIVPHAEFVDLEGAAHTAAADDNDAFTETVSSFISRL